MKTHDYGARYQRGEDSFEHVLADACCPMSCKCSSSVPGGANVNELWRYASGIDEDIPDLVSNADHIDGRYRRMNAYHGFSRKDDWVEAWFTPRETPGGPLPLMDYYRTRVLAKEDVNHLLDDYYAARGWDVASGIPVDSRGELPYPGTL